MSALADTSDHSVFINDKDDGWQPIADAPRDGTVIDVWMEIHPSPMSMGMSDSFGVPDAWFENGKWVHTYKGRPTELDSNYITLWRSKQ